MVWSRLGHPTMLCPRSWLMLNVFGGRRKHTCTHNILDLCSVFLTLILALKHTKAFYNPHFYLLFLLASLLFLTPPLRSEHSCQSLRNWNSFPSDILRELFGPKFKISYSCFGGSFVCLFLLSKQPSSFAPSLQEPEAFPEGYLPFLSLEKMVFKAHL